LPVGLRNADACYGSFPDQLPLELSHRSEDVHQQLAGGVTAASDAAHRIQQAYADALQGIRAVVRGEEPIKPDAFLLRDMATILIDGGFRPGECYRLKWGNVRDGGINIDHGKGRGSWRRVPCTQRIQGILEMRASGATTEWVFPAKTRSGHIESSTLKKQYAATLMAANVSPFVIYDLRHTCITRWAKTLPLPVAQELAGHTSICTTMRYAHLNDTDVLAGITKAAKDGSGHTSRHTWQNATKQASRKEPQSIDFMEFIGAGGGS